MSDLIISEEPGLVRLSRLFRDGEMRSDMRRCDLYLTRRREGKGNVVP